VPVNREKSGSGPARESALLGFRLEEDGTISIAPKSIQRLKGKVRELWEARQSLTSEQLRDQWRDYIQGWWNYYQLAERRWGVEDLTGWIRHHMRKWLPAFGGEWHGRLSPLRSGSGFAGAHRGGGSTPYAASA
jgi:RNA-directed DNA polymerase